MWQMTFTYRNKIIGVDVSVTVYGETYDECFDKALSLGAPQLESDNLHLTDALEMDNEIIFESEIDESNN